MTGARPLKVGVQLPEVEYVVRWPQLLDMARVAEDVGFDSLWVGDHLMYRRPLDVVGPWEAWSSLAALAAVTKKVELGPLVACTSFHSPAMLAKKAATVDEISGGRLILGLGAGWNEPDYTAYGFPFDRRVSRFEEAFTIIRTLLREGQIDFEGQFYTARDCELLPRGAVEAHPNGPPLMLGTTRPRMLSIAAPHIDMWNEWHDRVFNTPEGAAQMSALVDDAARAAGRDPSEIERTVTVLVQLPGGTGRAAGSEIAKPTPPLTGTNEELARAIARYADVGISHVQLVVDPITVESIESLAPMLEHLDAS
jgi:alkanesulfonate monooxygenase SsuD/methylene tetrahydromethanopterin reductase-like flavin-dependent oxidoreductase (luciferase family)